MKEKTNPKRPGSPQPQINERRGDLTADSQPQMEKGLASSGRMTSQVFAHGNLNRQSEKESVRTQGSTEENLRWRSGRNLVRVGVMEQNQ